MTDQLSGGVVQPTDAQIDAHWSVAVRRNGTTTETIRDVVRAVLALAVPQAPLQAVPVPVVASETTEQWEIRNVVKRLASQTLPENEDEPEAVLRLSGFIKMARTVLATPQAEPAVAEQAREAVALLDLFHNKLGPDRWSMWDDDDRQLWDRIENCRAALASQSTPGAA